ncbi:MAG: hypothetical protein OXM58_13725 [Rhodospirillaceae bacterium]|nr:hypothetical protein [Rhodospirillaceae bacterium]MDE0619538.1 hypothetical protein [Rhodospirillaceae bacterium]
MNEREFLNALLHATNTQQVEVALETYVAASPLVIGFEPVGRRPNNRGAIEVASDAGRSMIERVTNMLDALLELEHEQHRGIPNCRSPREAASAWLGVSEKDGLSALTRKERQDLAARAIVRLEPGEGSQSRILTTIDKGIGIEPDSLETTILSLNESNKIQKHYLAGTYGQGGSSTFAFCKYTLIVSRRRGSDRLGFTLVKYEDLPAEEFKTGRYVFLATHDSPLEVPAAAGDIEHGTIVRHFGYDLTGYTSVLGSKSVYGVLGRILFDPVSAIRFENQVNKWNRTIKGARNALNGAVDEGDDDTRGPSLDHHVPMFSVELGDYGSIGIEYWVLARLETIKGKKRTKPAENFVDATKPMVLTHNGQNHGDLTGRIIRDAKHGADLPFLQTQGRLICHVNCDRLSPNAKRQLFASTREQSREGHMLERIRSELIGALKADDELVRLNEEAREQSLKEKDEDTQKNMRREVAKLLRIAGAALEQTGGTKDSEEGQQKIVQRRPRPRPLPIEPKDPPTFLRIVWDDEKDIPFYAGQRRYVRVETDANSDYHDPDDPSASRFNVAVGDDLSVFGTSPLKGGRMRIGVECRDSVVVGSTGSIRIELYRKGLPALSDECEYRVVDPPMPKEPERRSTFPDFRVIPVAGPADDEWENICEDPDDTDVRRHASNFVMNEGTLYVYYCESFPRFTTEVRRFERQHETLAKSFRSRYETWLAVHSLLMYQETQSESAPNLPEEAAEEMGRQERARLAVIAAMVASQEVKSGISGLEGDDEAVA